tara:strand:+ start:646 stop:789 length:144 start_codon:yes stop_codon:yes gene_type:complete
MTVFSSGRHRFYAFTKAVVTVTALNPLPAQDNTFARTKAFNGGVGVS